MPEENTGPDHAASAKAVRRVKAPDGLSPKRRLEKIAEILAGACLRMAFEEGKVPVEGADSEASKKELDLPDKSLDSV